MSDHQPTRWQNTEIGKANIKNAGIAYRRTKGGKAQLLRAVVAMSQPDVALRRNISCYLRHERLAIMRGDVVKAAKWAKKLRELRNELKAVTQ